MGSSESEAEVDEVSSAVGLPVLYRVGFCGFAVMRLGGMVVGKSCQFLRVWWRAREVAVMGVGER